MENNIEEKKYKELPVSELEVMQAIWVLADEGVKPINASAMIKRCPNLERLKLTTVLTLVNRLVLRGFITSEKVGRTNCYTPLIDSKSYREYATKMYVKRMYFGSKQNAIADVLVSDGKMTKEEAEKIAASL